MTNARIFHYVYFKKKETNIVSLNLMTISDLAINLTFARHDLMSLGIFKIKIQIELEITLKVYGGKSSSSGFSY